MHHPEAAAPTTQPAWFVDPRRPTVLEQLLDLESRYAGSMPLRGELIDEGEKTKERVVRLSRNGEKVMVSLVGTI